MITSELECAGSCTVLIMPDHLFPDGFVASARFTFGLAADGSWEVAHMQQQSAAPVWGDSQLYCGGGEAGTARSGTNVVDHTLCSAVQCGCGVTEEPADPGAAALPDPGQAVVQWDACCVCDGVSDCLDACGVPNGANASCTDACGVVLGDNATCADACGVPNGDDGCVGCDGEPFSGLVVDACDVCAGDNSTCSDCEGTPNGETVVDGCGVCAGEHDIIVAAGTAHSVQAHCFGAAGTNASCVGCDGILFSNATIDVCGICAGTNESCSDACGVPHGNNASCTDLCGMLLGDGQSCLDACGVAFGTNESCSGCDGVPNSGRTVDACGSW